MPQRDENSPAPGTAEKAHAGLLEDRRDRYRQAAALLRQWREDNSGYDEKIWPLLEEEFSLTESSSKSR
jgi:hypothetical protein